MKKLQVRKSGPVRLSGAAVGCYTLPSCNCNENGF